jgi:PPOX class probable F420-dependent enzyme
VPSWPPGTADRLALARVGRLATVTASGEPHVVPVCFAAAGGRLWTAVDAKPKTTRALRRLENVRTGGRASLLVDHYEEDWSRLWWIRVDAVATVHEAGPGTGAALDALAAKYEQYRADPPAGPLIALAPERWRSWAAVPSQA